MWKHLSAHASANSNIKIRTYKQQCRIVHLGTGRQIFSYPNSCIDDLVYQVHVSKKEMERKIYLYLQLTLVQEYERRVANHPSFLFVISFQLSNRSVCCIVVFAEFAISLLNHICRLEGLFT